MSKVKDLLVARQEEIRAEIGALQAELDDIEAALAIIAPKTPGRRGRRRTTGKAGGRGGRTPVRREGPKRRQGRQPSLADQSLGILKQNPGGLHTAEIARKLEEAHGRKTTTRTLSTQLSAMKRKGRVKQDGRRWLLPAKQSEAASQETGAGT